MKWRLKVVHDYRGRRATVSESEAAKQTASRFDVGISTVRRWDRNRRRHGKKGLLDKVAAKPGPTPKVSQVVVGFIVLLRCRLGWGAQRIAAKLSAKGIADISHTTVHRMFKRYHLPTKTYHPKAKSNGIAYRRYQKRAPNQMWHLDFAGPFQLTDGPVYLLVVVDDSSRFALAMEVLESQETQNVTAVLDRLFDQYGAPEEILTDNGLSFTSVMNPKGHPFDAFCQAHGVAHNLTPTYYPESNGKAEALIKTIKREGIAGVKVTFISRKQFTRQVNQFCEYYNWHRLHSSLSYDVPSARFCGVRLKSSLLAVPKLEGLSLPASSTPQAAPTIDADFIHRHTALVPLPADLSYI